MEDVSKEVLPQDLLLTFNTSNTQDTNTNSSEHSLLDSPDFSNNHTHLVSQDTESNINNSSLESTMNNSLVTNIEQAPIIKDIGSHYVEPSGPLVSSFEEGFPLIPKMNAPNTTILKKLPSNLKLRRNRLIS